MVLKVLENKDIIFRGKLIKKEFLTKSLDSDIYNYQILPNFSFQLIQSSVGRKKNNSLEKENLSFFRLSDDGATIKDLKESGINEKQIDSLLSMIQKESNIIRFENTLQSSVFFEDTFELNLKNYILLLELLNPLLL